MPELHGHEPHSQENTGLPPRSHPSGSLNSTMLQYRLHDSNRTNPKNACSTLPATPATGCSHRCYDNRSRLQHSQGHPLDLGFSSQAITREKSQ